MLWSVAVTSRRLWKGAVPASYTSSHANLIAVGVGVELESAQRVTVELTLGPSTLLSQEDSLTQSQILAREHSVQGAVFHGTDPGSLQAPHYLLPGTPSIISCNPQLPHQKRNPR